MNAASLLLLLAASSSASADDAPQSPWRLVGAYDLATTIAQEPETRSDWTWQADSDLTASCGPAKAPDGLWVFEAQSMSGGLAPTLALVLRREGNTPSVPLTSRQVRVSLGRGRPEVLLQPAVLPRAVQLEMVPPAGTGVIDRDEQEVRQLLQRQLEMLLCLEHKVGRGWSGASEEAVRQAILLAPPDGDARERPLVDRKYFGGQRSPALALLGPPRACLLDAPPAVAAPGRGEVSVDLIPADLWGAGLGGCRATSGRGAPSRSPDERGVLPLTGGDAQRSWRLNGDPRWGVLTVDVRTDTELPESTGGPCIQAEWSTREGRSEKVIQECLRPDERTGTYDFQALPDVLARVPYELPSFGPPEDPYRYAVVLIPNWQLVEARYRLSHGLPNTPLQGPMPGGVNAVAWVLEHSDELFVQVKQDGSAFAEHQDGEQALELTTALGSGSDDLARRWGYMAGLMVGREPIVVPGEAPPSWDQVRNAHRAEQFGAVVVGLFVWMMFVLAGLTRLPELWSTQPSERAAYWPGRGGSASESKDVPDEPGTSVVPAEGG